MLAWDVDFYQDVRVGDSLKVLVERFEADGRFLRHGEVLAAEYEGKVTGRKRLFRYTDPSGDTGYYDDAGTSARRGFLKAPVPYVHLTSRFGSRRHPLLGYVRAHQGVDYGAPGGHAGLGGGRRRRDLGGLERRDAGWPCRSATGTASTRSTATSPG